jgi:predicted small lipoprotein YifL
VKKLLLIAMLSLMAASCGVKNDLEKPDGTTTPKNAPDPSKPPFPVGR